MYRIFIIILAILLFASCAGKKAKRDDHNEKIENKRDSIAAMQNYDKMIGTEEKAKRDTVYGHSEAYRYAMENYHRQIAEKTKGMSHVEQLLYEYEVALKNLNEAGKDAASNPEKMKDPKRVEMMRERGRNAMKIYERLKTFHMTTAEKERFDRLNKNARL